MYRRDGDNMKLGIALNVLIIALAGYVFWSMLEEGDWMWWVAFTALAIALVNAGLLFSDVRKLRKHKS